MAQQSFRQLAEWQRHRAVWLAWPSARHLWRENLAQAQHEFTEFAWAIADMDEKTGQARGEALEILVPSPDEFNSAANALKGLPVRFHEVPFGDIWLRDTGPIFLQAETGERAAQCFRFNGWGGKYNLPYDQQVAGRIATLSGVSQLASDLILEGGSIEVDGEGTLLTTEQCLLNPNRNPNLTRSQLEALLADTLGVEKVLWLKQGLINDHTDGHIDTIARFVSPGVVVCMQAQSADDPNRETLVEIAQSLAEMSDAQGRRLKVIPVPSPGRITNEDGEIEAASYVNFYIANSTVVVPIYNSPYDQLAVEQIGACFPTRRTVGVSARAILSGGGAFHCISQHEPS